MHKDIGLYILGVCDYRWSVDWIYWHNSLISTIHKSPQHPLSNFQPAVFISRSPTTASNSRDFSASRAQVLPSPTLVQNCLPVITSTELDDRVFSASLAELNCTQLTQLSWTADSQLTLTWPRILVIQPWVGPKRKHRLLTNHPLLLAYSLPRERVYRAVV
jgi:hypothetical protein